MAKETTEQAPALGLSPADISKILEQNQALLSRIERLENPGLPQRIKRSKDHTGHLRMWEGELVLRIGTAMEDIGLPEHSKNRLTIEIGTLSETGKQTKKVVNYLDFLTHARKVKVKFLKIDRHPREEIDPEKGGGGVITKISETSGWKTGEDIDVVIGYVDLTVEVEVTEGPFTGQKFTFDEKELTAINA